MSTDCTHTPQGAAFTELILETFHFNGRLLASGNRLTEEFGISSALWQVMGAIDQGPRTVSQIARMMGLSRQSVQRSANALHNKGIVAFMDNAEHKRAKLVTFTDKGRMVMDLVTRVQIAWANDIASKFEESEITAATRLMRRLAGKL
jgi:DNA-binding MarR family transcriptional regulator